MKKPVTPAFASDLSKEDEEKDDDVVCLEKEEAEFAAALV